MVIVHESTLWRLESEYGGIITRIIFLPDAESVTAVGDHSTILRDNYLAARRSVMGQTEDNACRFVWQALGYQHLTDQKGE